MATRLYGELGRMKSDSRSSIVMVQEGIEIKNIAPAVNELKSATHDGVEFVPSYIEFNEASEGISCQQRITIKNIGTKPSYIRIYQPTSIAFQVKTPKKGVMLNPGLSISTTVTYNFKRPSFLRAIIPIEINGHIVDYQVVCKVLIEGISAEPHSIDFGFVDIGYSSGVKVLTLKNEGGKSTRFSIDLGTNDLEITVKPMRGIVKPNKPVQLTVELIGMNEGEFYSEFWIKSIPNIRVPFKVSVIVPRLVIYHPNATGDFTLIDFSTTLANTRKYDSFVLRNISAQVASYVVLGEIDNEVKWIRDIDRRKYPVYSVFDIRPVQGRIGPFEGIVFEVGFSPTLALMVSQKKLRDKLDKEEIDFMAFVRIVRVHVTETQDLSRFDLALYDQLAELIGGHPGKRENVPIMNGSSSTSSSTESSVEAALPDIVRLCLHGEVQEGRLKFQPNVLHFGDIRVGEDSQRVVRISNPLKFTHLLCRYVQQTSVRCHPRAVMLKPEGSVEVLLNVTGRESVKRTFNVYFDVEAYSYESQTSRRRIKIKVGTYPVRCSVNVNLVVTVKKMCKPIVRSVFATDYEEESEVPKKIRRISAPSLLPIKSGKDTKNEKQELDDQILKKIFCSPKFEYRNVLDVLDCDVIAGKKLPCSKASSEVLIPLTPLQIYNVRMYPTLFSFGMVVPKSRNYRQLIVENLNEFPVLIRLANLSTRCVSFPQGDLILLPPGSLVTRLVEFRAQHIGKFNGYIDYIINDNHSFELAVTANIVEKQLSLDLREVVFGKNWMKEETYKPMDSAVRIKNKLGAKINFRWEVPGTCCFFVEPMSGTVRGHSSLYTYICYKPNVTKVNCTELTMKCEKKSYISLRLQMPTHPPKVSFLKDTIDVGEIPLNLPTKAVALLRNFEHFEVEFVIDPTSLVPGCFVEPSHGIMPPRGIVAFEICLTFGCCFHFTMTIRATLQKITPLQFKLQGTVTFPELRLLPRSINLRRIPAYAYQHYLLTATNAGTTVLKLRFLLEDYPEFRISHSPRAQDPVIDNEDTFILPGNSKDFHLHFQSTDLASYAFYLPFVINDIFGPASMYNPKTLKPSEYLKQYKQLYELLPNFRMHDVPQKFATLSIDCTIARNVVFFNKLMFQFNVSTGNVSEQFFIENSESAHEKSILIDTGSFTESDCPFLIRWADGVKPTVTAECIRCTLQEGERCCFVLEFQPKFRGNFSLEAPIFIRDESNDEMFNKLCLAGEYYRQAIHARCSELYFPPVALNNSAERVLRLSVEYFEKETAIQAKVKAPDRFSGVYNEDVLSVSFAGENVVPAFKNTELAVKIVFASKVPVSFRTTVEFSDASESAACQVWIYATADNSLLTLHPTIRTQRSIFEWPTGYYNRVSRHSKLSYSTDEEENGIYSPKTGDKPDHIQEVEHGTPLLQDETKKSAPETLESVCSTVRSIHTFGELHEPVQYPFFPFGDENDEYEIYMKKTMDAAEEWLYTGPFKFNYYPQIPSGITMSLAEFLLMKQSQFRSSSRRGPELGRTFIDVLEALLGPSLYDHIVLPKSLPEKDSERANCMYSLYNSILNFMIRSGAHLCHVLAQFLLNYDEYVAFIQGTRRRNSSRKLQGILPGQGKLSLIEFMSRSKQCWLDVILQTYKCFVLPRITELLSRTDSTPSNQTFSRRSTAHRASIASSMTSLHKFYDTHDTDAGNIQADLISKSPNLTYSSDEMFLLGWLQYHYEEQRMMDWMTDRRIVLSPDDTKDVAEERKIENFDSDLSDSLVLCTVTAAYCSFLIEESFRNLYICPRNFEEAIHNAVCVVNAWRKIRLGFIITPMDIVYPNCVKMLMLVAYLFHMLPTYIPRTKVKFSCPLTETVTKQINFTNPTGFNTGFLIVFFGNSNGFFRAVTPQSVVRLSGHKSIAVNIEFYAKKIRRTRAYLLFCGSTVGPYFSRNHTFILEGQADNLAISSEYTIRSGLYQAVDKTLTISVPYQNSAEYEIWMSELRPSQPRALRQTRWSELCLRKIPRRLFLNQKTIVVNENTTEAYLSLTVACITPIDRSFWLILQSNLGDFIIQINSQWQASLTDNIVIEWNEETEKCICTDDDYKDSCALSLSVPIPSRNKQLWSCVAHMFQKTLDPKERMFWSRYLDTHIGLRLIRWLMGDSADAAAKEFTHIFNATVTYNVSMPETSNVLKIPKTFTINDVRPSMESVRMKIHISPLVAQLCEEQLTLTSVGGKERRTYTISFLHR